MKIQNLIPFLLLLFTITTVTTGCAAIEKIFKAGVWVGALIVVGIIGLIVYIIGRNSRK